eukprot:TRINITY_DN2072_c0_g1_i1.p1 TRINITY_DN2072_c0_g1~~TRINITY_DN2072_c0_g1_i1.p1  ORF type:complete len:385 (+),score=43.57 TRINITY_DN2072_c0_g1_i1:62-1216(+)
MNLSPGLAVCYSSIILMPLVPIVIGAHRSLTQKATETMTANKAYFFPVLGSGILFGLYMLFKLFSKDQINLLLTAYFLVFSIGALTSTIAPWIESFLPKKKGQFVSISTGLFQDEIVKWVWERADLLSLLLSVVLGAWYVYEKHWIANNIIGLAFCIQTVGLLSLGSYRVSCILLIGLFFYDIFWVFGTDVMVTVAKSFDAPIKLVFPRDIFTPGSPLSMLGLGDIVFPGFLIAMMLRFDLHLAKTRSQTKKKSSKARFAKTYFYATLAGYVLGLFLTISIMHIFKAAQPALLYLVPTCLGSSFLTAFLRGELAELWNYNEDEESEKPKESNIDEVTDLLQSTTPANATKPAKEPSPKVSRAPAAKDKRPTQKSSPKPKAQKNQ